MTFTSIYIFLNVMLLNLLGGESDVRWSVFVENQTDVWGLFVYML